MEALDTPRHHEMRGVWAHDFERAALECEERRTKPDDDVISRMFVSDFGRTGLAET